MKKILRVMIVNLKLAFCTWPFWLAVLGVIICYALSLCSYMQNASLSFALAIESGMDAIYLLYISQTGTSFGLITNCVLPLFPFACALLKEVQHNTCFFWIGRTGCRSYVITKYVVNMIAGCLVLLLGQFFIVLLLCTVVPLSNTQDLTATAYDIYLSAERPMLFLAYYCSHTALTGTLYASMSFAIASFVDNTFVAYSLPVVLYFFLIQISSVVPFPVELQPQVLTEIIYSLDTPEATFLVKAATTGILCGILCVVSVVQNERRIRNG